MPGASANAAHRLHRTAVAIKMGEADEAIPATQRRNPEAAPAPGPATRSTTRKTSTDKKGTLGKTEKKDSAYKADTNGKKRQREGDAYPKDNPMGYKKAKVHLQQEALPANEVDETRGCNNAETKQYNHESSSVGPPQRLRLFVDPDGNPILEGKCGRHSLVRDQVSDELLRWLQGDAIPTGLAEIDNTYNYNKASKGAKDR